MSDWSPYLGSRLWLDPTAVTAAEKAACGGVHARASLAIPALDFSVCALSCDCGLGHTQASTCDPGSIPDHSQGRGLGSAHGLDPDGGRDPSSHFLGHL